MNITKDIFINKIITIIFMAITYFIPSYIFNLSNTLFVLITLILWLIIFKMCIKNKLRILKKNEIDGQNKSAIILITKSYRQNRIKRIISYLFDDFLLTLNLDKVVKYFNLNKTPFNLFININSKQFEEIMLNKNIKELYIYTHGTRYGICLADKYYEYINLKLLTPKIKPKEYIAQIHCGNINKEYPKGINLEQFTKLIYYKNEIMRGNHIRYYNNELIKGNKLITTK